MNVVESLLNAQRRSDEEARRITSAMLDSLSGDEDPTGIGALSAAETEVHRIAEEKAPRRAAPAPAAGFGVEQPELVEFDPEPDSGEDVNARASTHFLIGGGTVENEPDMEPVTEPEPTGEPEPDTETEPTGETEPETAPSPETETANGTAGVEQPTEPETEPDAEPETEPETAPDAAGEPSLGERLAGLGAATAQQSRHLSTPTVTDTPAASTRDEDVTEEGAGVDADPEPLPETDADPEPLPDPEEDTDPEPLPEPESESESEEETGSPAEADSDPSAPPQVFTPVWEQTPPADSSPWDSASEIVRYPDPEPDPAPVPATEPEPATAPEPDPEPAPAPAPLTKATSAPASMPEPESAPEPTTLDRIKGRIGAALSAEKLRELRSDPRSAIKLGAIAAGVLVLVVVVIASLTFSGRSTPPEPAQNVAPPAETAPPGPDDAPLVPATVSASCGNDSDAVAPFSGDKSRAWVCERINGMDLNVLNITFNTPVVIDSILIVPGFAYVAPDGRDEWARHRVVTSVTWRMGGKVYPQNISPTRTGVSKEFDSVITKQMSMTVTGSERPKVGDESKTDPFGKQGDEGQADKVDETTAVSKIVITGHPVDPGATGK